MLSLANVYELGVTLSSRRFTGAGMPGGGVGRRGDGIAEVTDMESRLVLLRADGFAGTGGGCCFFDGSCFLGDGYDGLGVNVDGRRGVEVKSGSLGVGWLMCSGMKLK